MEEIKFCPHCGHANKGSSNFCENCGSALNAEDNTPQNDFYGAEPFREETQENFNETPAVEKSSYNPLNYSQVLRRNLFMNPWPLISGSIFFVIAFVTIVINKLLNSEANEYAFYFIINIIMLAIDMLYVFIYLVINPLRAIMNSKKLNVQDYHISFFRDRLHYQLSMNVHGQEFRNDFFLMYKDIFKVKEYKDMMILGFVAQGQLFPLCILKDEYYDRIISLMQDRIDQLSKKR